MKRVLALLAGLLFTLVTNGIAAAQEKPPSAETTLAPVAWLVGGTWVSDVKDPSDGSITHVENHISWAPNHQAVQFVTDFNGRPHYNGFYAYDPVKKSINFYYTSEQGLLTIGTATPGGDGKTLTQEFDTMVPNGKTGHMKSTITRDGPDTYVFQVFAQQNGEWKLVLEITYKRQA